MGGYLSGCHPQEIFSNYPLLFASWCPQPCLDVTALKEQEDGPFAVIRVFIGVNEGPVIIHS